MSCLPDLGDSYVIASALWSLVGFGGGYLIGRLHCRWRKRKARNCE